MKKGNMHIAIMKSILVLLALTSIFLFTSCKGGKTGENGNENNDGTNSSQVKPIDQELVLLNKRIADNPNDYSAYLDRARYFGDHQIYGEAFADIARAIAVDSTRADIYLYRGDLYFDQQKVQEAYDSYKKCLSIDSLNVDGLLNKTGIDIVLANYDMARSQINTALRQNEFNPYAYYLRGRLYKTTGDTTLAASSYKTAIEVDPNYYDAYIEVGLLYAAKKNDLAKEYYSSAISIRPQSIEAWYNKAMYLQETGVRKKGRYQEAFACYDSILSIDPSFVAAHFNKGYIWLEYLNQYDSATTHFTKAINLYPQYYQAYLNRGLSYESLNKKKEAESDYRQALAINPQYTEAAKSLSRVLGE
jgi:tetratricopeptide (TPR) repeat protein